MIISFTFNRENVSFFGFLVVLTFSGFARLIHHCSTTMSFWVFTEAGAGGVLECIV